MGSSATVAIVIGSVLMIAGIFGLLWCKKRSFHRKNELGVELFDSYWQLLLFRIIEGIVAIASVLAIVGGILVLFQKLVGFAVLGPTIGNYLTKIMDKFE